jgi:hypothetical protein
MSLVPAERHWTAFCNVWSRYDAGKEMTLEKK